MIFQSKSSLKVISKVWPFVVKPSPEILAYAESEWSRTGVGPGGIWYCEEHEYLVILVHIAEGSSQSELNKLRMKVCNEAENYELARSGSCRKRLKQALRAHGFSFCFRVEDFYCAHELGTVGGC